MSDQTVKNFTDFFFFLMKASLRLDNKNIFSELFFSSYFIL